MGSTSPCRIGFVDPATKEKFLRDKGLHEVLAREICELRRYNWRENYLSAVDYLLEVKEFVKIANYGKPHNYVAVIKTASKTALNVAAECALIYDLPLFAY